MPETQNPKILRPLTHELKDATSPVRRFLDDRLATGLRAVQSQYLKDMPPVRVPPGTANAGTVGTAADWLLRMLVHPTPSLAIPLRGAMALDTTPGVELTPALCSIAQVLEIPPPDPIVGVRTFAGPVAGNGAEPELLARASWSLALLTEAFRAGPLRALQGPLQRFKGETPSAEDLLELAPADALEQLTAFRRVYEESLLPHLAKRRGEWTIGPTFTGSRLMKADADLVTAGLLLELKTSSKKPALSRGDAFQLIGYALLDFNNAYRLDAVALFSARYGHLAVWPLSQLLDELSGRPVDLLELREEFRSLLIAHHPQRSA